MYRNTIRFEDTLGNDGGDLVRIGQSYTAVWVKVVSGWICHLIYIWSLVAPIAMPDMVAIEAVLEYEKHDYIYFCARPEFDGKHNFARTHKEHEANAKAYHNALNELEKRKKQKKN